MTTADALFNEADINRDGSLSQNEFRNFVIRHSNAGLNNSTGNNYGALSSYETSTFGDTAYTGGEFVGTNYGRSSIGNSVITDANTSAFQQYETDAQGNFKDLNPQIIRRPDPTGPRTYTQNVQVRFLQPPAASPPGPLIIKEVRPPQPPPLQPLRVRQQAPPLPTPSALVLRERPPPKPASVASQTVVRNLNAIPVPPRSVVIERVPPTPPKPRDIVIERWVPYGPQAQRRTIVQRAESARSYPPPRNVIIEYEPPKVRVIRQFQRLGITPENPQEYVQRYGASLLDSQTLLQQARVAGVVEDISVPAVGSSMAVSSNGGVGFEVNNIGSSGGGRASFYDSSSSGNISGLGGFRSTVPNISTTGGLNDGINAVFAAADTNNDGFLTQAEFQNAGF